MIQMYPRDRARCLLCAVGIASLIPHSPEPQRAHLRPVTITRIRPLLALSHIGAYCPVLQDTFRHG